MSHLGWWLDQGAKHDMEGAHAIWGGQTSKTQSQPGSGRGSPPRLDTKVMLEKS